MDSTVRLILRAGQLGALFLLASSLLIWAGGGCSPTSPAIGEKGPPPGLAISPAAATSSGQTLSETGQTASLQSSEDKPTMKLESPAFAHQSPIPKDHTEDGKDISPPLRWSNPPEATREFALICDDPDAPSPRRPAPQPWVHWVIYGIPANVRELPAGIPQKEKLDSPAGARQGKNSWGTIGYRGPAPPRGSGTHRYVFTLYALDQPVNLGPGATKAELLKAMDGHILATAQWIGTYERP
ncbi:MAG: YbhB/YbcL family Raf kinase inhibitor-like protein [Thermoguttaceae bacterium]|nr:YbhB/YbcL family Raf kinase inhibitor-like protein [Thermoguttaceae bacterium]MDW8079524.1 YbhB/YbcL family Raf kinase inhibitor-like protein [Thermoguttaceae bacterium]